MFFDVNKKEEADLCQLYEVYTESKENGIIDPSMDFQTYIKNNLVENGGFLEPIDLPFI